MPRLTDRLDVTSVTSTLLLPKGKKRGHGTGFCGGAPVVSIESGQSAFPFRWLNGGKPEQVTFQDIKKIAANSASETQIAGYWSTPKGDYRALVWTATGDGVTGTELHPTGWEKSVVNGCGDGQQ